MSNALALASVTAVLKDLLDNALVDHSVSGAVGGPVTVTALAPNRIKAGDDERTQLNLFLYHVTPNSGWRNEGLPSRNGRGDRLSNPPLALDLFYLLSAYGKQAFECEILLGYAMQMLHETPVLSRDAIRKTLTPPSPVGGGILPPALGALAASDLAEQVEQIKLSPQPMSTEEMSKMWSAFQANYRPSAVYQASVVLIESTRPSKAPLPVLTRGVNDKGVAVRPEITPSFPGLVSVLPPNRQSGVRLGEVLSIKGHNLDGDQVSLRFTHPPLTSPIELAPLPQRTATELSVQLPDEPANWPAGFYTVAATVRRTGEPDRTTNELAFALAPRITTALPISVARDAQGKATLSLTCSPQVLPGQRASLVLGEREILAQPRTSKTSQLQFVNPAASVGEQFVRLRVDGVESLLLNRSATLPVFDATQTVTIT
jgi:hypothetical protein